VPPVNVLGVTLARGGSKSVPKKNIYPVLGKPLIVYTIEEALKANLGKYVVLTDSQEILDIARSAGAEVMLEPPDLANDTATAVSALQYVLENTSGIWDVVADIRCTNPLKTAEDIDRAVRILVNSGADAVAGVRDVTMNYHPSRLKQMVDGRLVDVWPEPSSGLRQELTPNIYVRNGGLYVVLADALRDGILFKGGDIRGYIMPPERCANVDDELDLVIVEAMVKRANRG